MKAVKTIYDHRIYPECFRYISGIIRLLLLKHEPRHRYVAIATGLKMMRREKGIKFQPYKVYEWNRMRHPVRIGSAFSTLASLACCEVMRYLHEQALEENHLPKLDWIFRFHIRRVGTK